MPIIDNAELETHELPGLRHRTIGGHKQGVKSMEVWSQAIAPRSATPVHRHACEEVILIVSGVGTCTMDGEAYTFGPDSTLVIAPDVVHQIVNTSDEEMHLVAALGMAPVRVRSGDGTAMQLPWDAPSN